MRRLDAGGPEPLGLTLVRGGANVAVFSAHAQAIDVCLFDATGETEGERIRLPERTGDVFHGFIAGIAAGHRYGLRAHGPYDPPAGHRFNAAKLLVDPYARVLDRPFALDPAMFGEAPDGGARDDIDSGHVVPKGVATPLPRPAAVKRPHVPWSETIVYELHVRGFTKAHPDVPQAIRGTCAGLAHPAALDHLVRLGVTTVELMPITATIDERHLVRLGLSNYWGYNPAALFVPDARLAPGGLDELRACVAALHAAGIEVVLDIVLNHTGEGDEHGPTVSLRGLDNATYYRTLAGNAARYADDAGCGNTLALDRPPVLRLALDALRHYADIAGVDGFRFDLATTLGRRDDGFDATAPFFQAVAQDPLLRSLKLIAEPWDIGPDGYRLGAFPASWGEWNDRYRDTVRRFWRGDANCLGGLATRLAGSSDLFASRRRPPSRSVNFVAAHDGFTLADLVSYETKHNDGNGEGNRDGSDTNLSWNHGTEGPTADPAIGAARARDVRSLLATLLVSRGTPMLAMGDELGRTQRGNNNAYSQDNALTWIDWTATDRSLADLVATLIALRRGHRALRLDRWLTGGPVDASGMPDVAWRHPDGRDMAERDWSDPDAHALVTVLCAPATDAADVNRVAIAFNAGHGALTVCWPAPRDGYAWRRRIDTSVPSPEAAASADEVAAAVDIVAPRAVVVIVEERAPVRRSRRSRIEPDVFERLTTAAGIATDWWDVAGRRHEVTPDTKRSLLGAMGLGAASTDDARARLTELADASTCRPLPPVVVARAGHTVGVPLAGVTGREKAGVAPAPRRRQRDVADRSP